MAINPDVLIVGAGLAGLCCGRRLAQCGVPFLALEASDGVGGRVRTDPAAGFRLDRGFQVFLPDAPEAVRVLDYDPLDLRRFAPGALAWSAGRFRRVAVRQGEPVAAVPANGMQAIPDQIAGRLPAGSVRLGARVEALGPGEVRLAGGEVVRARAIVVAADGPEAARLTGGAVADPVGYGSTTLYYAADRPPVRGPVLLFDEERTGPASGAVVMSEVSPAYAPPGQALVAVCVAGLPGVDDAELDRRVREQLAGWFGATAGAWRLLRVYRVPHALSGRTAEPSEPPRSVRVRPGLYVCGGPDDGSIDGAMTLGFRAAQAAMEDLAEKRC